MLLRAGVLALSISCRGPVAAHMDGSPSDPGDGDARTTDSASGDVTDGTPMRLPCTSSFGSALSSEYGRMDGYLVAIVPPAPSTDPCNADPSHLHLQVQISGAVYDVAVNVGTNDATNDVHTTTIDHTLLGPAWSEGWHTNVTVDYPTLGVHSNAMPLQPEATTVAALMAELATANHVSIYATGYNPVPSGAHLVHRYPQLAGHDGLVVTHPLSATAHARLFSFTTQTF
jgi:hypothetical protein